MELDFEYLDETKRKEAIEKSPKIIKQYIHHLEKTLSYKSGLLKLSRTEIEILKKQINELSRKN